MLIKIQPHKSTSMPWQRVWIVLLVLNILLFGYSCFDVDKSKAVNFFRYNEDAGISTLDPAFVRSQAEIWASSQIFEGLVELDDSLNILPCIAKKWTISEDGLRYTFVLKDAVYFYDYQGKKRRKLSATDFVYSFTRIVDPSSASPGAWIFNDKIDTDILLQQDISHPDFPFKSLNDSVFQITLNTPFAPFLSLLAMPYCFVVMQEEVELQQSNFRTKPTGTGPFRLATWEEEVQMLLHKNPFYHQKFGSETLPFLDGIMIDLNKNKQAAFMGFLSGKYDFFNGITSLTKDELFTKKGTLREKYSQTMDLKTAPFLNMEYLGFNLENPPNGIKTEQYILLRKALNMSCNRTELVTYLKNGLGNPADKGFVPNGIPGFDSLRSAFLTYDPILAEKLMKSMGFNLKNQLKLSLNTTADYTDIAILLKNQWKKIYVDLNIEIHPGSFLRQLRNQGKITLFRGSWIADYPDPENFLACFYSPFKNPNGPNYTLFENQEFDSLYRQTMKMPASSQRLKLLASMDSIIVENPPVVFLFYDKSVRLVKKNIKGLEANPMNFLRLKTVSKI
jgi:ABC-type transport system substrate-binding protein